MRTTHQAVSVVAVAALILGVAACGGSSGGSSGGSRTAARPVSTPSAAPSTPTPPPGGWQTLHPTADNPLGVDWSKQQPFTGPAVAKFGAANVMAAYRFAVTFSLEKGYTGLMAKGYDARPVEFSFVNPYLTTKMQKIWEKDVAAGLAKDADAGGSLTSLTGWNADAGGKMKFRDKQRLLTLDADFSPATTSVQTIGADDYLVMRFTVSRKLRVMDGSKPVLVPVERDITYRLTPNGMKDFPWLIDAFDIQVTGGTPVPDPLGASS